VWCAFGNTVISLHGHECVDAIGVFGRMTGGYFSGRAQGPGQEGSGAIAASWKKEGP
jgi:hypothetical protein